MNGPWSPSHPERISGHSSATPTDGDVVLDLTLCTLTARGEARVDAAIVLARLVHGALGVAQAIA